MLKQDSGLCTQTREAPRGKWPMITVAALIYSAITGGLSSIPFIGWISSLLAGLPVAYGFAILMLAVFRGAEEVDLGVLSIGFQEYSHVLTTRLLQAAYTFLWSLLLLIPDIIKYYSHAMTDYTLKDEPELRDSAAIERDTTMMEDNKMKLFPPDLSFVGWATLCFLILGIGFSVLQSHVQISHATFYEDSKVQQGGTSINVEVTVEGQ